MTEILGKTVVDSMTGFTGVAIGHVEYVTGCNQTLVQPRCKPEGDFVESRWLDDERLSEVPGGSDRIAKSKAATFANFGQAFEAAGLTDKKGSGGDKEAPRR